MTSLTDALRTQHFRLILQVVLLLAFVFLFCFSIFQTNWVGTPIISLILVFMITANIVRLVEKSNRDFAQFIANVSHNDFASASGSSDAAFGARAFIDAQKTLLSKYRKLKADRTVQTEYLQLIVEHIDAALICFDEDGNVEIINQAAARLLGRKYVSSINIVSKINPDLATELRRIRPGEYRLIKLVVDNELNQLILNATEFVMLETSYKLVSMQNIKNALDEREIESWQKLIRVLTHEIMNSMTPIVSLSRYIGSVVKDERIGKELEDPKSEQLQDLRLSIDAIASRSQGLMEFVGSYRSLSNLPDPVFETVELSGVIERIQLLLNERVKSQGVRLITQVEPADLSLHVDEKLLEQILINLLSNAIDAVEDEEAALVELEAVQDHNGRVLIRVTDNGCGISKELIENIFTPFYTTKEHGTGIGLSLSRQLARLNRATISVSSIAGEGSQFVLTFSHQATP
ncbi:MAG: ATP-binding protein [Pseudomonadales bacterium]|nr:ATP-binding protein [Pseudomonadales bacterium]